MTTIDYAMRVATSLQNENKLEQAQIILTSILEANPGHAAALHLSGVIAYQTAKIAEGIKLIQQAIENNPAVALFHSNLGEMYRQLKNLPLSIECGQRAVALDPYSATAFSNLGIAYYDANLYAQAEDCHKRALAINPTLASSLNNMGSIYKAEGKLSQAILFYQAAIAASPPSMEALNNLATTLLQRGTILMDKGDITNAEKEFLKIPADSPVETRILAHYSLIQLRQIQREDPSLKALLSMANTLEQVSVDQKPYFYFALGKCYDDMGEWSKAFAYFTQGCDVKRKRIIYDSAKQIELTQKLIQCFTKETIDYLRSFANSSALPIFIVGMPRSGSTLVEQILASHADVFGAGELIYLTDLIQGNYPDNIFQLSPANLRAIADKYLFSLQRLSSQAIRITDKMPHNYMAIGLIHALLPHAKIIHVKRNAIDSCLSCYTKLFRDGHFYSYDLTELGHYYLCYERIMNHWRSILPSGAFIDVHYENIIQNLETEAKRMVDYCELKWDPACLDFYQSQRQVRTASFMQVRKPLYASSVNKWRHFEKELAPLIKLLA